MEPYRSKKLRQGNIVFSRYYGVSPWAIARANRIHNMNYIYAGQRLCIP